VLAAEASLVARPGRVRRSLSPADRPLSCR